MASVLITGASSGIGEACARRLDQLGHRVFAGVRSEAAEEQLRAGTSERLRPVIIDVTEPDQVAAAAALVDVEVGVAGLDGLVNNAGIAVGGPVECVPLEEWRRQFETNVIGQVSVTQAMLPLVRRATGRIVFIGSMAGRVSTPLGGPYGASKRAIGGVVQSLREELHPWGIAVSIVEPGAVRTPIWEKGASDIEAQISELPESTRQLYGDVIGRLQTQVGEVARKAAPVDRTVEAVEHALFDKRPRHRYPAGGDAKLVALFDRVLPDRALSWILRRTGP